MQAPPTSHQPVDHGDMAALQSAMLSTADRLSRMAPDIAKARVVKECYSDRCKRELALAVREFLNNGDSAAASEVRGLASPRYAERREVLNSELAIAEGVLSDADALRVVWESQRSALGALKTIAGNL